MTAIRIVVTCRSSDIHHKLMRELKDNSAYIGFHYWDDTKVKSHQLEIIDYEEVEIE